MQVHGQIRSVTTYPVPSQPIGKQLSDVTIPLCYIQMANGQLKDLRRLCGKRSTSPASPRGVQRPSVQPVNLDSDGDEPTPRATAQPQPTTSPTLPQSTPTLLTPTPTGTPLPTNAVPQPTASPSSRPLDRPTNVQPVPTMPTPNAPHPLAIPRDRD